LLSFDNLLVFGVVGGAAAYLTDFQGFKQTVNGWIDGLKLTSYDPLVPNEVAAVEGGNEGSTLEEPVLTKDRPQEPAPVQGDDVTAGRWSENNFMFGGYEFPSEEAFDMNNYYPIEGSESGIAPELKEYTMLVPKWNVMPDVRGLSRRQADDIEYQMG
jgi:hypothetical protein